MLATREPLPPARLQMLHGDKMRQDSDILFAKRIRIELKKRGYNVTTEDKVASLVVRNSVEFYLTPPASPFTIDTLRTTLDSAFDEAIQRKGHEFRLNSNEPVLLLDVTLENSNTIRDEVVGYLRNRGIMPVRVYMQLCDRSNRAVVLNVVNTDIGGPSMVDMLDSAFHEDWRSDLVLKEAWNGWNLLWRDETWPGVAKTEQNAPHDSGPGDMDSFSGSSSVSDLSDDIDELPSTTERTETASAPIDIEESAADLAQHPAYLELQQREQGREQITHPSWTRDDDSRGLLDIIESQSADMSVIRADEPPADTDGFEVVERAK